VKREKRVAVSEETYRKVEQEVMPVIRYRAGRLNRLTGCDVEDAAQRMKIALWTSLQRFDPERGDIVRFASKCLTNAYRVLIQAEKAQKRRPTVPEYEDYWKRPTCLMLGMDDLVPAIEPCGRDEAPDDAVERAQKEALARELKIRLRSALDEREQAILMLRLDPPPDLLAESESDAPSACAIARYLYVSRNQVNWSLAKIRKLAARMIRTPEFQDLLLEDEDDAQRIAALRKPLRYR